jgi:hypothetical protein
VITTEIVRTWVYIPRSSGWSIDAIEISLSDIVRPVILCDISSVRRFERFILNLGGIKNGLERWQRLILEVSAPVGKSFGIKAEQGTKDTNIAQSTVDKILVRASKIIIDDPVEITLLRNKAYIDEGITFIYDTC